MMQQSGAFPGGQRRLRVNAEINVTPFVDVMLVLLIIFMVAAPMMTVGVPVDLPRAAMTELPPEDKALNVFIKSDGSIYVGDVQVARDALAVTLAGLPGTDREQRVRLRADRDVSYENIMAVMEALSSQGFSRIGLVAAPKSEAGSP